MSALFDRLRVKMAAANYSEYMIGRAKERIEELERRGVHSPEGFMQRLLTSLNDKEEYLDILMEGRFSIVLARNGFKNIYLEYSIKGPDIKAEYNGAIIYFEVTRRRPAGDEWGEEAGTAPLVRIENIIDKIRNKLQQLQEGEINIIVLWSATAGLGDRECEEAFNYIKQECTDMKVYGKLSGVLFTNDGGIDTSTLKQFYLFKNDDALNPISSQLSDKLETMLERDYIEVKREVDELNDVFRKAKS